MNYFFFGELFFGSGRKREREKERERERESETEKEREKGVKSETKSGVFEIKLEIHHTNVGNLPKLRVSKKRRARFEV